MKHSEMVDKAANLFRDSEVVGETSFYEKACDDLMKSAWWKSLKEKHNYTPELRWQLACMASHHALEYEDEPWLGFHKRFLKEYLMDTLNSLKKLGHALEFDSTDPDLWPVNVREKQIFMKANRLFRGEKD